MVGDRSPPAGASIPTSFGGRRCRPGRAAVHTREEALAPGGGRSRRQEKRIDDRRGPCPDRYEVAFFNQGAADGLRDPAENQAILAETDLGFGRVDVHVDGVGGNGEMHDGDGMAPGRHHAAIGLGQGPQQGPVGHPATIYEEGDVAAVRPVATRLPDEAFDPLKGSRRELDSVVQEPGIVDAHDGVSQAAGAGSLNGDAIV